MSCIPTMIPQRRSAIHSGLQSQMGFGGMQGLGRSSYSNALVTGNRGRGYLGAGGLQGLGYGGGALANTAIMRGGLGYSSRRSVLGTGIGAAYGAGLGTQLLAAPSVLPRGQLINSGLQAVNTGTQVHQVTNNYFGQGQTCVCCAMVIIQQPITISIGVVCIECIAVIGIGSPLLGQIGLGIGQLGGIDPADMGIYELLGLKDNLLYGIFE